MPNSDSTEAAARPVLHKWLASLIGLVGGPFGLHRLYLRQPLWWLYPILSLPLIGYALRQVEYYREWAFFGFGLIATLGWLETITICLLPIDKFNERFNANARGKSSGGSLPILVAMLALILGTVMLMSVLALMMEDLFTPPGG